MFKKIIKEQNGETNIVPMIILLVVAIIAVILFGPYIRDFILEILN